MEQETLLLTSLVFEVNLLLMKKSVKRSLILLWEDSLNPNIRVILFSDKIKNYFSSLFFVVSCREVLAIYFVYTFISV